MFSFLLSYFLRTTIISSWSGLIIASTTHTHTFQRQRVCVQKLSSEFVSESLKVYIQPVNTFNWSQMKIDDSPSRVGY